MKHIYIMLAYERQTVLTVLRAAALSLTLIAGTTACTDTTADVDALIPVTAGASAPGAWGTVTRGFQNTSGLSNLQLHYPALQTNDMKTYNVPDGNITQQADALTTFGFTTTGDAEKDVLPLYWQQIAGKGLTTQTFYLTAKKSEKVSGIDITHSLWASTTFTPKEGATAADQRAELDFSTTPMKSREALLTLVLKVEGNMDKSRLSCFLFAKNHKANPAVEDNKQQAIPATSDVTKKLLLTPIPSPGTLVDASTTIVQTFAPQDVPTDAGQKMLVIAYNTASYNGTTSPTDTSIASGNISSSEGSYLWTLDLSQVKVNRPEDSEYKDQGTGFRYNANEHITLTISISFTTGKPGGTNTFVIDDYEATTDDWGNFDVTADPKPPTY